MVRQFGHAGQTTSQNSGRNLGDFPCLFGRFIVVMDGEESEDGINLGVPGNRDVQGHR